MVSVITQDEMFHCILLFDLPLLGDALHSYCPVLFLRGYN